MRDLINEISRHPLRFAAQAFVAFSVLLTITEGVNFFVPNPQFARPPALGVILLVSLGYALVNMRKPSRVEIEIANSNTVIEVVFGDLFQQEGIRAIAVNEFFDSQLGKPVSAKSLHGIFLARCFGGHPQPFDDQVNTQLNDVGSETVTRSEGKSQRYPIGTTALIMANSDKYLAFASAKTDIATCKANADVAVMWVALNEFWKRARIESGGDPINVPLVGSGLSGVGLPTRDLLNVIVLSVITATKVERVTERIRIVLSRDRFDEIDLREAKKYWET